MKVVLNLLNYNWRHRAAAKPDTLGEFTAETAKEYVTNSLQGVARVAEKIRGTYIDEQAQPTDEAIAA